MFDFASSDNGKNYIIELFDHIKRESRARTENMNNINPMNSNKSPSNISNLSNTLFETIKPNFSKFIFNSNASSLLIKVIHNMNFSKRFVVWKIIEENNFIEYCKNNVSSNVIINIINEEIDLHSTYSIIDHCRDFSMVPFNQFYISYPIRR